MAFFRIILGLCFVAIFAVAMRGLRYWVEAEGHQFMYGMAAGIVLMFAFTWLYEKVCQEALFKDSFSKPRDHAWPNTTEPKR